ncbi:response regulator transcription factor [Serinibacter salmoneus]|uniref:DNA-binding response OmpR family regulator n=1 Tax=Serinibacter salmoneus TaxID=556530 RepID=A0A2A9CWA7_9MICO|nr:response regulator transcription factor [Serinibacter salmoneus]PFG18718.1 DNA-binding response OmpR family regulator [Serinibacter salmoneus]
MRILVVDDERSLARAIKRGLEAEGFTVDLEHDGVRGLAAIRLGDYDAVVLDIMLPGRNGYDVVTTLREEGNWTPVLLLSAKDGEYDVADGLDVGADDYLTKPFAFVVLVARIRAIARRPATARPATLEVGAVTLDPALHEVRVAGEKVELTSREFALLEYLMRHRERVVSKTELLEHVWDSEDVNLVEQYVGYVRRKIGRERIATVRGAGYRAVG